MTADSHGLVTVAGFAVSPAGNRLILRPVAGGELPADGVPTGNLTYQNVTQVTLPPFSAAVLLAE